MLEDETNELFFTAVPSQAEDDKAREIVSRYVIIDWDSMHILKYNDDGSHRSVKELTKEQKVDALKLAVRTYDNIGYFDTPILTT